MIINLQVDKIRLTSQIKIRTNNILKKMSTLSTNANYRYNIIYNILVYNILYKYKYIDLVDIWLTKG